MVDHTGPIRPRRYADDADRPEPRERREPFEDWMFGLETSSASQYGSSIDPVGLGSPHPQEETKNLFQRLSQPRKQH